MLSTLIWMIDMVNRVKAIFVNWLVDDAARRELCRELGLSTQTTVNGKTMITNITDGVYSQLQTLADRNVVRLTLKA